MNFAQVWARRLAIVITVGGSFALLSKITVTRVSGLNLPGILIVVACAAYLLWGLAIGVALTEGRVWAKQLVAFLALQIPYVQAPGFGYHVLMGIQVLAGYLGDAFKIEASWGPDLSVSYGGHDAWELGVNLVPVALIVVFMRSNNRRRAAP